jgi:hypothetical protein
MPSISPLTLSTPSVSMNGSPSPPPSLTSPGAVPLETLFSNQIKFKIFRWKESAKATCAARKEKIIRASTTDFRSSVAWLLLLHSSLMTPCPLSSLYRKSQMALKAQNSDSSAEGVEEEFNFDVLSLPPPPSLTRDRTTTAWGAMIQTLWVSSPSPGPDTSHSVPLPESRSSSLLRHHRPRGVGRYRENREERPPEKHLGFLGTR